MEKDDSAEFEYSITINEDNTQASITVSCEEGMTEEEFGAAIIAFGKDLLDGAITFDDGELIEADAAEAVDSKIAKTLN